MQNPKQWSSPISYRNREGFVRKVTSTQQAGQAMFDDWPDRTTANYRSTQALFLQVMAGSNSSGEARSAFANALEKAGFHQEE